MTGASAHSLRSDLRSVADDRATIARERNLLDRWAASLDVLERNLRRALDYVDPAGQHMLLDPAAGRAYKPQSSEQQREAVLQAFTARPGVTSISQVSLETLTGLDSGALSRAVRDLEVMGKLERHGKTARRSTVWAVTG